MTYFGTSSIYWPRNLPEMKCGFENKWIPWRASGIGVGANYWGHEGTFPEFPQTCPNNFSAPNIRWRPKKTWRSQQRFQFNSLDAISLEKNIQIQTCFIWRCRNICAPNFWDFARIVRGFPRIFDKLRMLGVRLHPVHPQLLQHWFLVLLKFKFSTHIKRP